MPFHLRYAARSNVGLGSKSRNEDSGFASSTMLVLADGMGGHAAGDVASSTVVGTLAPLDNDAIGADDALDRLADRIAMANDRLREQMDADPSREGMGTTLIVLIKAGRQLAMANIGDSRAYQVRDGKFAQITKDHSFVQSLLDSGRISPDEAVNHPQRSLVTRVLTGRDNDVPDLSLREARIGDRYLLCSDGLSDYVGARTIEEIFTSDKPIDEIADELIDVALKGSTRDNVTVVIGEVVDDTKPTPQAPQVVGAAMAHGTTQAVPTREPTPAEKAAALSRELSESDEDKPDEAAGSSPLLAEVSTRRKGLMFYTVVTGLLGTALLAGLAVWGWIWSQNQYYVKDTGGRVTVYQGVDASFGPLGFSHIKEKTDIPTQDLPTFWRSRASAGIGASTQQEAIATVEQLRNEMVKCLLASPSGSECSK